MNLFELKARRVQTAETMRTVVLPRLSLRRFTADDLSDLTTLRRLTYARPTSKIWPTLNSFVVLEHKLFAPDEPGNCLVVFQITVSPDHDVHIHIQRSVR